MKIQPDFIALEKHIPRYSNRKSVRKFPTASITTDTYILDCKDLVVQPICEDVILAPGGDLRIVDQIIIERLTELEQQYDHIHPAYAAPLLTYAHILEELLEIDSTQARFGLSNVIWLGGELYHEFSHNHYESRPLGVSLLCDERYYWSDYFGPFHGQQLSKSDVFGENPIVGSDTVRELLTKKNIDENSLAEDDLLITFADMVLLSRRVS